MKTLEQILELKSDGKEFFKIYRQIWEKYWTVENPSDYQQAAKGIAMFAERYDADMVILAFKICFELMNMREKKSEAATLTLAFSDLQYFVDIYQSEVKKDELGDMLVKISSGMKKDKFGKRYFQNVKTIRNEKIKGMK